MMKRGISILLSLLLITLFTTSVYAGYNSWTGPDSATLHGLTWMWSECCSGGETQYKGNSKTWRSNNVYKIKAYGKTWTDCDYWHSITSHTVIKNNYSVVETGGLLAGSNSSTCTPATSKVQIDGTHGEQFGAGGPWFDRTTTEIMNVP